MHHGTKIEDLAVWPLFELDSKNLSHNIVLFECLFAGQTEANHIHSNDEEERNIEELLVVLL